MKTVNIKQAADLANVSPNTMRKWLKAGLIPYRIAPLSGYMRIVPDDLRRFVESWEVKNLPNVAEPLKAENSVSDGVD